MENNAYLIIPQFASFSATTLVSFVALTTHMHLRKVATVDTFTDHTICFVTKLDVETQAQLRTLAHLHPKMYTSCPSWEVVEFKVIRIINSHAY